MFNIKSILIFFSAVCLLAACKKNDNVSATGPAVTTFAGSGTAGASDSSSASLSTFRHPQGLAMDAKGNLYIADVLNNKIRKVTSSGVVSTVAGSGQIGSFDTTVAALATFNGPSGLCVDTAGNIFVADAGNNKIRKISNTGVVTTIAGTGVGGGTEGAKTAATFLTPLGVAIDAAGNLYVADYGNDRIRKVTQTGTVSAFAGSAISVTTYLTPGRLDGVGTAATFFYPSSITIDGSGNLYVTDSYTDEIRKITTPGALVTTVAGGTQGAVDGTGSAASFNTPFAVCVDASGNLYVADNRNNKIRKITPAGVVTTLAGSGASGSSDALATGASFNLPQGIAVDASGNVYVADAGNNKIRMIAKQ
jgi:sugar lactone lactonase YvrE